jgi:hypothetical protein
MRKLAAVLSMAIVCALVPATSGARTADCEDVMLRTWNVKVDVAQRTYRIGDDARVALTVTRKKTQTPVADAWVGVMLTNSRKRAVFGFGETNPLGVSRISIDLKRKQIDPGPVELFAYAYQRPVDTFCATVAEFGYRHLKDAFRAKR